MSIWLRSAIMDPGDGVNGPFINRLSEVAATDITVEKRIEF